MDLPERRVWLDSTTSSHPGEIYRIATHALNIRQISHNHGRHLIELVPLAVEAADAPNVSLLETAAIDRSSSRSQAQGEGSGSCSG